MIKRFLLILVFLFLGEQSYAADSNRFILKAGKQIWVNSGHTFASSEVEDKEFNEECYELFYSRRIGDTTFRGYGYAGRTDVPVIKIYENYYFMYDIRSYGLGMESVLYSWTKIEFYLGLGFNYTSAEFDYNKEKGEKISNIGPDVSLGISSLGKVFIDINLRYSTNRMMSTEYTGTTWSPVGLKTYIGMGFRW